MHPDVDTHSHSQIYTLLTYYWHTHVRKNIPQTTILQVVVPQLGSRMGHSYKSSHSNINKNKTCSLVDFFHLHNVLHCPHLSCELLESQSNDISQT